MHQVWGSGELRCRSGFSPCDFPQSGTRGRKNQRRGQKRLESTGDTLSGDKIRLAVPDYLIFSCLRVFYEYMVCEQIFFDLHHSDTHLSLKILTVFGPRKSPASFSRGASDVEPEIFAVSMSAKRVCADLKISRSAENGCGARTFNNEGLHLSLRCVTFHCVTFHLSNP